MKSSVIKQEALALELGENWSQKKVSRLEEKEVIEDDLLDEIAKALKITPEAIKNFDEQAAVNYFTTFNDNSSNNGAFNATHCTFNPLDRMVELYERMLKDKNDMIDQLQALLKEKK